MCVLEDDFDIIFEDFHERFESYVKQVPPDWDLIYLGGGYGEAPMARTADHVFRVGRMMTTSSYGITLDYAKKLAPALVCAGPIDCLFSDRNREAKAYVLSPRMIVQFPNYSDLQGRHMDNSQSMLDRNLEAGV